MATNSNDRPFGLGDAVVTVVLGAGVFLGSFVGTFKTLQALTDRDFGTAEFPPWFRREFIAAYVRGNGPICPGFKCDRHRVRRSDLTVDHITPKCEGGRTSTANAGILCRWCNSRKSDAYGPTEWLFGRGGGSPRRARKTPLLVAASTRRLKHVSDKTPSTPRQRRKKTKS